MAEGHIHGESSVEVQIESACEEMLIEETVVMQSPKVPVQPESSQSRSLSISSGNVLSRVYKPRCRLLGVSSEEDEKSEESTTSDNKDVEPRLFRSRSTVSGSRNVHKWKNVSLI